MLRLKRQRRNVLVWIESSSSPGGLKLWLVCGSKLLLKSVGNIDNLIKNEKPSKHPYHNAYSSKINYKLLWPDYYFSNGIITYLSSQNMIYLNTIRSYCRTHQSRKNCCAGKLLNHTVFLSKLRNLILFLNCKNACFEYYKNE